MHLYAVQNTVVCLYVHEIVYSVTVNLLFYFVNEFLPWVDHREVNHLAHQLGNIYFIKHV